MPPPTLADFFPLSFVVTAARRIRDTCLVEWPWQQRMLGREWIAPNEWVDVQLGVVFGPRSSRMGAEVNGSTVDDGVVTVYMADGSNGTVRARVVNDSHFACSGSRTIS